MTNKIFRIGCRAGFSAEVVWGEKNRAKKNSSIPRIDEHDERDGIEVSAKKPKTLCKYLQKWGREAYPYLTKSNIGQSHAFCKICCTDFSVSHGGKSDVSQHEKSAKHKRARAAKTCPANDCICNYKHF